jgi:hypothetical protein
MRMRSRQSALAQRAQRGRLHGDVVQRLRAPARLHLVRQQAQGQDGARGADGHLEAGAGHRRGPLRQNVFHVRLQPRLVAGRERVGVDVALGQAQHAQLLGDDLLQAAAHAQRQLQAAAADVDHQRAPALQVDAVQRGQVDETRLPLAGDGLGPDLDGAAHLLQEVLAVGGLADGGGGHRQDLVDAVRLGQPAVAAQGLQAAPHGLGRQPAAGERARAQADHLLLAAHDLEGAGPGHVDDHEVERVAAQVHGGDAH